MRLGKSGEMKIWIEKDGRGFVYVHPTEPNPGGDPDDVTNRYWETKGGGVGIEVIDSKLSSFLGRGIKKDTVAEFELKCVWERA